VVTSARTAPELPGLEPDWSRIVFIEDHDGSDLGIHVLDAGPRDAALTIVCVHGNPTWSYLWRGVLASAPEGVRVLAVDQVGMGYSARSDFTRRLADRIDDLAAIIRACDVTGRVIFLAHDWGGPITVGLVERLLDSDSNVDVTGLVLCNTAVHQPEHRGAPVLIAGARLPGVLSAITHRTPGFVVATTAISSMDRPSARALRAPYGSADDRRAIKDFVADIPLSSDHPSRSTLEAISKSVSSIRVIPVLLVWGMRDPVFSPRYLDDLRRRLPHAHVQQFDDAGHLVLEDRPDAIADIWRWIDDVGTDRAQAPDSTPSPDVESTSPDLLEHLRTLDRSDRTAVTELVTRGSSGRSWRRVSWTMLADRVARLADAMHERGVQPGDRVALLVPPGADLLAMVYALWRIGAVIVVIDAAHGPRALYRSLRAARLDHVVAVRRARPVVSLLRVPGAVVWVDELTALLRQDGKHSARTTSIDALSDAASGKDDAAIVFTSGATGPAKPVAYTRQRIAATRDVLMEHYGFTSTDVLVAAFAPWAVLGPLLGISSVIPSMDPSKPGTLTADALAEAMERAGGTVMWMSPAALRSVLSGASPDSPARDRLRKASDDLRLLLIAGAPVSRRLLHEAVQMWPQADVRTPYGMTEVLPASDVRSKEILDDPSESGVLVGTPLPGVDIAIAALDGIGEPSEQLSHAPAVLGEVVIRARHAKSRYDSRAFVERRASRNRGWHRSGDIGILDEHGRLWIQGRLSHVITPATGPIGPVPLEQRVEVALSNDGRADLLVAAVGVGPAGTQVPVIVCAPAATSRYSKASWRSSPGLELANTHLANLVRTAVPEIAAVLWRWQMPVDIRHGAKIDRRLLADEVSRFLAGRR
jgi:acyl-coenzyme A synthetase/AMP-(fatty) acid ligase/pimeloyl-ACP methyl ester carboxylesterase